MRKVCVSFKGDFLTMCFSIKVAKNINQLSLPFNAEVWEKDAESLNKLFFQQKMMEQNIFEKNN